MWEIITGFYGMYVCPDIDTIIYGLSGILDEDKGWGVKKRYQ